MSDLIEKVVDAMTAAMDGEDCSSHGMARAAIAAVAEWLEQDDSGDIDFIKFQLRAAGDGR